MELELKSTISRLKARSEALPGRSDNYKLQRRGRKFRSDNVVLLRREDGRNSLNRESEDKTQSINTMAHAVKFQTTMVFTFSFMLRSSVAATEFPGVILPGVHYRGITVRKAES